MKTRLRLLGTPRLEANRTVSELPLDRPASLGYYLAQRGDWVRRGELAYLYNPEADEASALNNLRKLVFRLKQQGWAETLEAEPSRLRLNLPSDVYAFRAALGRQEWAEALGLYGGTFLEGLAFPDLSGYEAWLELERQDLARAWRRAALEQVRLLEGRAEWLQAEQWLGRLLRADPLDEDAVQALMRVLQGAGKVPLAKEAFERFRRDLGREMGVEPLEATRALADSLRSAAVVVPSEHARPRHNLPVASNRFVGRKGEIEALSRHLANPDCRLLTVVGLGGIGKTRLALELVGQQAERFADGVWLVALSGVAGADLLVSSIAAALSLVFSGPSDPKAQLINYLRAKESLLVLDNFEHLLEGGLLLEEMLAQAPSLKLLVTSRVALETPSEWLYDLGGLPYPPLHTDQDLDGFDAVRLFVNRAERLSNQFVLTPATLEAVAELTRRVQGMPLALELAATWVRGLSVGEILSQLSRSFELLQTTQRDLPERHRNLQAILEYSWQLLSEAEQTVLARLSVFRGGFTLEAAQAVAGAHLGLLLRFINQALVLRSEEGRYDMHELVREFAAGKLEGLGELESILEKHVTLFCAFVEEADKHLNNAYQVQWKNRLRAEQGNLTRALEWGAAHHPSLFVALVAHLGRYWESRGNWSEAEGWLDRAIALDASSPTTTRANLYLKRLSLAGEVDEVEAFEAYKAATLELCQAAGDKSLEAEYHNLLGLKAARKRQFEQARVCLEHAWALAKDHPDSRVANYVLLNFGHLATMEGNLKLALQFQQDCLELARKRADLRLEMITLCNMGARCLYEGNYAESTRLSEQALAMAILVDDQTFIPIIQGNLGYSLWQQGDHLLGERTYREHVRLLFQQGNLLFFYENAFELAQFWHRLGYLEDAVCLWGIAEQVRLSQNYPLFDGYGAIQSKVLQAVKEPQRTELLLSGKGKSAQENLQFLKTAARE